MSFDRLAPVYRAMEWVLAGGKLQRCRTEWMPLLSSAREVLVVGEGPGRWIEAACHALPLAYWFFRWSTGISARRLTDIAPLLRGHGFGLERERRSDWGLLSAALWRRSGLAKTTECG